MKRTVASLSLIGCCLVSPAAFAERTVILDGKRIAPGQIPPGYVGATACPNAVLNDNRYTVENLCDGPLQVVVRRTCNVGPTNNLPFREATLDIPAGASRSIDIVRSGEFSNFCIVHFTSGHNSSVRIANAHFTEGPWFRRKIGQTSAGPTSPARPAAGGAYVCYGTRELNFAGCKGYYTYLCNRSGTAVTAKAFYQDSDGPLTTTRSVTVTAPANAQIDRGAPELVGGSVFGHNGICRTRSWSIALPGQ